jgi:hypothetical protein
MDPCKRKRIPINLAVTLILKEGYNFIFATNTGMTALKGSLTIENGTMTMENLIAE